MEFEALINLITEKSVTIIIIGYFIFRDFKFMGTLNNTLSTLVDAVNTLKVIITNKGD